MDKLETAINKIKNGYIVAIDWVVAHPHRTVWSAAAAIACLAYLAVAF